MRSPFISVLLLAFSLCPRVVFADELAILSPHWEGIRYEMAEGFKKHYRSSTGREVSIRWLDVGGASDIVKFIKSEFGAKRDGIEADLVFGGGTDPFIELNRGGYLDTFEISDVLLSRIPRELNGVPLYDPDYHWYATALSTFGILSNKDVIEKMKLPRVSEWRDLARHELHSWIGAADPRKSGSIHLMYEAILQAYGWNEGWRILFSIGGNARNFSNQASQVVKDIASGEVAYGLAIDSYAFEMIRKYGHQALEFVVPANLSPVTGDAIGILRGAPNLDVAKAFVLFVLSDEGQKLFYFKKGSPGGPHRYELAKLAVVPALYEQTEIHASRMDRPFTRGSTFRYDAAKASRRWTVVNDLIGTWIVDNQDKLTSSSVHRDAPVTEDRVDELVRGNYPGERSRLMRDWALAARSTTGNTSRGGFAAARALPIVFFAILLTLGSFMRRKTG